MAVITSLLGESPFRALKAHGEKVYECIGLLRDLLAALAEGNPERQQQVTNRIWELETEADKIRNHLHEQLSTKALLPIAKEELFNVLEQQDSIADRAEDIAALLSYRDMRLPADLMGEVRNYLDRVLNNCELSRGIMSKLDLLVESSFGGRDAITVSRLIGELLEREDEFKPVQIELTRKLLAAEPQIPPTEAMLWMQVIGFMAELFQFAVRTGNGLRLSLKIKHEAERS